MNEKTLYNEDRRYIFTNWTSEDFTCSWGGIPTEIKSGETIELPEYKAYTFAKHLVDREMMKGNVVAMDSKEARKPYEDKTIMEITAGVDSPALAQLKEKIKEEVEIEVLKKAPKEKVAKASKTASKEFEDIN